MNPNSETIELRANKNLIRGSGQQQSKLYLIVNIGVDYESVERNILSSSVLLVCFHKVNKVDKAKFLHPTPSSQKHHSFYFILFYIYFSLLLLFFVNKTLLSFVVKQKLLKPVQQ